MAERWDVKVCATISAETAGEAYEALGKELLSCAELRRMGSRVGGWRRPYVALEPSDPVKSLEVNAFPRDRS